MPKIGDYNKIMSDRNLFNQVVYTPLHEAVAILKERQADKNLNEKIDKILKGRLPKFINKDITYGVLFRHMATPNNETRRFLSIIKDTNLSPIIYEYHEDLFSPDIDGYKHSLAKMRIHKDENQIKKILDNEYLTVVDFNKYNHKKIKEVLTKWEEPLVDFHKSLFKELLPNETVAFWDSSKWCEENGKSPKEYYKIFFLLFVTHGVLFENFLLNEEESEFSKNVILPSLEWVMNETGLKPLIVPIDPIDTENDNYWYYYSSSAKLFIKDKLKKHV